MRNISIRFEYNLKGNDDIILDTQAFYDINKSDRIIITNREIFIEGTRGNKNKPEAILYNTKSTLYKQLLKAIVYLYMTTGNTFVIGNVTVKSNNETIKYTSDKIINPCTKNLPENLILKPTFCSILFNHNDHIDSLLVAYLWYIKAIQADDFDYYWKSFNSIYAIISKNEHEQDRLRDMRSFMEKNWSSFNRLNQALEILEKKDIRKLRIREFVLNNYDNKEKTKAYADMIKSFKDYRMAELFDEIMPYREEYLKDKNLYSAVQTHIDTYKRNKEKRNIDLARFYILKYTYFLRNKYFHAEKFAPEFILTNNNEISELVVIKALMRLFLSDLLEMSEKYI